MIAQLQLIDPALVRGLGYVLLFLLVAPLFPLLYVVMRWRLSDARPGLGTYGGLLYFRTAALLLAVAGAANLTYGMISTTPVEEELTRLSWGLFVGSAAFMLANTWLGRFVRVEAGLSEARRVFGGFLMILAGLVAFFVVVMFFITLFEKVDSDAEAVRRADELKLYGSWSAFYLATYLAAVILLARGSRTS